VVVKKHHLLSITGFTGSNFGRFLGYKAYTGSNLLPFLGYKHYTGSNLFSLHMQVVYANSPPVSLEIASFLAMTLCCFKLLGYITIYKTYSALMVTMI
jgi:hypothetical protein